MSCRLTAVVLVYALTTLAAAVCIPSANEDCGCEGPSFAFLRPPGTLQAWMTPTSSEQCTQLSREQQVTFNRIILQKKKIVKHK